MKLPQFNLFTNSLVLFLAFAGLQILFTVILAFFGAGLTPALSLFMWFACSAAVGFAVISRYKPQYPHLLILQATACLYPLFITCAILLKTGADFNGDTIGKTVAVITMLYVAGCFGFMVALWMSRQRAFGGGRL